MKKQIKIRQNGKCSKVPVFHYPVFHFSCVRMQFVCFSTYHSSSDPFPKVLAVYLEKVYNYFDKTNYYDLISRTELSIIKDQIVFCNYVFSPLHLKLVPISEVDQFLLNTLPSHPDVMFQLSSDGQFYQAMLASKSDILILIALSQILLPFSPSLYAGGRTENRGQLLYKSLKEMIKVNKLHKLDLNQSLEIMPKNLILEKIKCLIGSGYFVQLIDNYLHLPIIDDFGMHHDCNIPTVCEITRILFDIILMEVFDREFTKKYPGIKFVRFVNEVFIPSIDGDGFDFDEKTVNELLSEFEMKGKIKSIGPGDVEAPLQCYQNFLFVSEDGKIMVFSEEDFREVRELYNKGQIS